MGSGLRPYWSVRGNNSIITSQPVCIYTVKWKGKPIVPLVTAATLTLELLRGPQASNTSFKQSINQENQISLMNYHARKRTKALLKHLKVKLLFCWYWALWATIYRVPFILSDVVSLAHKSYTATRYDTTVLKVVIGNAELCSVC